VSIIHAIIIREMKFIKLGTIHLKIVVLDVVITEHVLCERRFRDNSKTNVLYASHCHLACMRISSVFRIWDNNRFPN